MEQDDRYLNGDKPEGLDQDDCREEKACQDLSEDCAFVASGELVIRDLPEMKALEYLKIETGTVDIGKTINDLFVTMQKMDAQLKSVLTINAALEKDIRISRDVIDRLKAGKNELENTITILREEMPSKRDLQVEIEHLIEERNQAQASIRSMKILTENAGRETHILKQRVAELENEKADLKRDINYLELKLNATGEKLNAYVREVNILKGERLSHMEKIGNLRQQ